MENYKLIKFSQITDDRGKLAFVENKDIPFKIERIFYIYENINNMVRGCHAHKNCQQLLISMSGEFEVLVDNGENRRIEKLSNPIYGLYINCLNWVEIFNFSPNAICMVLASEEYKKDDYIFSYEEFLKIVRQ